MCSDEAADLEREVTSAYPTLAGGLERAGVDAGHRPTRLRVQDLSWSMNGAELAIGFTLPSGAFATSVLCELAAVIDAQTESSNT